MQPSKGETRRRDVAEFHEKVMLGILKKLKYVGRLGVLGTLARLSSLEVYEGLECLDS